VRGIRPKKLYAAAMIRMVARTDPDFGSQVQALVDRAAAVPESIEAAAREVIRAVRQGGDDAIRQLTWQFEQRKLSHLELPRAEWRETAKRIDPAVKRALEQAAARIRAFHEHEHHPSFELAQAGGVRVGSRVAPLARVGLYVPGGKALYPSTVLMTAIPAQVAGVREIVMTTPGPSPETLAAAQLAGVDRVFTIGGAQAIAALAYGTASIPRVDKIVGPGNAYVAAAKRLVFGDVGIDSVAGPTEVVIVADDTANPRWIAADLLAQAEHAKDAGSFLVTTSPTLAPATDSSIALYGSAGSLGALVLTDMNVTTLAAQAQVRFVNVSPDLPALDVYANDVLTTPSLLQNSASSYALLDAIADGTSYRFDFDTAGTTTPVLTLPAVSLIAGGVYTIYVMGPAGASTAFRWRMACRAASGFAAAATLAVGTFFADDPGRAIGDRARKLPSRDLTLWN
jgi:histidinol dehydrogenase